MRFLFASMFTVLASTTGFVRAGDSVAPRKQFKESAEYPFVFKPQSYLPEKGPLPMRFTSAGPVCSERKPPPAPVPKSEAKADESSTDAKPSPEAQPAPEPSSETTASGEAQPKHEGPDFAKVPDEVLEFFKNTEGRPLRRAYLFDPIFQPVVPDEIPKSKATFKQK